MNLEYAILDHQQTIRRGSLGHNHSPNSQETTIKPETIGAPLLNRCSMVTVSSIGEMVNSGVFVVLKSV